MNAKLAKAIAGAVEQLIEMILFDKSPQPEIASIHIIPDPHNKNTHLCVYADLPIIISNERESVETTYPYQYAIYINRETCQTECDGY